MSRTKQVRVSRVADWAGWCSPCESEDRPLVLTRTGPAGSAAWLAGFGDDDRFLLLTCNVCGDWQVVPPREEDDPEVFLVEDDVVEAVTEIVHAARTEPVAPVAVPVAAPMPISAVVLEAAQDAERAAAAVPAARVEDAVLEPVSEVDVFLEVPPVAAPRPERIVTVPDATTLPAFSPEAVAAARRVLEAARAETQRTAPRAAEGRPAPLDRSRRTRNTATTRRTERPAAARVAVPAPRAAVPVVATSFVLPAVTTSQLVLAAG